MHNTSYNRMAEFVCKYLGSRENLKILDVGSYDVNGTYRALFADEAEEHLVLRSTDADSESYASVAPKLEEMRPIRATWEYVGADIRKAEGRNVDVEFGDDGYNWPLENNSFDVVVSGQTMEHVADLHLWIVEFARVLKPGGLGCLIAPWTGDIHCNPHYWLILPDGLTWLVQDVAGLELIEPARVQFKDCIGVVRKPG